jgi:large subunit ribosomal protein L13
MRLMTVIDASGHVMGRLSSFVAKRLLQGEEIHIVNAEKAIITGDSDSIFKEYQTMREIGSQRKGPFPPKRPDRILKRTVRGMIPYQKPRGRAAFKKLRVHIGVPSELEKEKLERIEKACEITTPHYIQLAELSKRLGSKF